LLPDGARRTVDRSVYTERQHWAKPSAKLKAAGNKAS